ncbi:MAG: diacylglycerol kinase family protein [Hydrogenoanaerobacterium sp.]
MSSRIKNLIVSFRNAARGVAYCVNNERNMRIHIVIACYIVLFSRFFSLTQAQFALMLCAIALVIAMEMINTAVEVLVNIASPSYSALARVAKDVAAGAVLVCAAFAFAIGLLLFWKPSVFLIILKYIFKGPLYCGLFVLSVVFSIIFIFVGPAKILRAIKQKKNNK